MILEVKHIHPRFSTGIFFAFIFGVLLLSCESEPVKSIIDIQGQAQGTYYSVKYLADEEILSKRDFDALFSKIDSSLSTYHSFSLINQINEADTSLISDALFIEMMKQSELVYKQSKGAFDPTVMPLVRAWGFGPEGKKFTSDLPIDSILMKVGWDKLEWKVNENDNQLSLIKAKGMQLDFNAIAQGYTSDLIADLLDAHGIENYLVDSGGELKAKGKNHKGGIWTIGIDSPDDDSQDRKLIATFVLNNKSVATSGNYRKFYVENGIKYSHTISPTTGKPVNHQLLSATVITDSCSMADAYATALMVMGTDKAIQFIEAHPTIEAYLVYSDDKGQFLSYQSEGLDGIINEKK